MLGFGIQSNKYAQVIIFYLTWTLVSIHFKNRCGSITTARSKFEPISNAILHRFGPNGEKMDAT